MEDEFAFISSVAPKETLQNRLKVGIGDDAAVYVGKSDSDEVVCVDTMVEGIHFRRDTLTPFQIGRKALAINVSDLAAMGANPAFYLVSLAIPPTWKNEELTELYRGMNELAAELGMDLIGGDTTAANESLVITITAIGTVRRDQALRRSNAKAGDIVFVTGELGASAAGLELLLERTRSGTFSEEEKAVIKKHQEPEGQVQAGRVMAERGCRIALNDISDGLASEAIELAEASEKTMILKEEWLPLIPSHGLPFSYRQRVDFALNGGEDFQLVGTMGREDYEQLKAVGKRSGLSFLEIGYVEEGPAAVYLWTREEKRRLDKAGYNHFRRG
ncbi:thiamine-phosphate kinase [Shouchella shacheensis]|uniref:thiamine-phosphate kinase n=1 Tax=Shouchella shacheensis TaxID=1649580 RepID=UPI00074043EB|nr:thiamine-phosphate kinase [Shouchella shacheensis]